MDKAQQDQGAARWSRRAPAAVATLACAAWLLMLGVRSGAIPGPFGLGGMHARYQRLEWRLEGRAADAKSVKWQRIFKASAELAGFRAHEVREGEPFSDISLILGTLNLSHGFPGSWSEWPGGGPQSDEELLSYLEETADLPPK